MPGRAGFGRRVFFAKLLPLKPRVPDAVQRETKWSGAPLIRDRHGP